MSEFSRETLLNIIETDHVQCGEASALASMALAVMDSSESVELPLDYLQGHKDGLEWAAQLAEANHPETGDWLYDDPIELAKAIRKGPDMPPVQPVADSEPVAWTWHYREQWHVTNDERRAEFVAKDGDVAVLPLYRHAQTASEREQVRSEHAEWSQATFGNVGPVGPLKHLSKEALEAAAEPGDLSEWADMQFLLWDAQRRAGITDEQITQAMIEKLAVNKQRKWPEPKDGEPRLHIKEQPAPVAPAVSDDIGEIRVGRLPTMNQDDYPGLGDWWVQLRIGEDSDEVLARVYGATPQEANNRAEALACRAAMLQTAPAHPFPDKGHRWSYGLIHPENCQCIECRSARLNGGKS